MKEMVGGCCVCSDERGWPDNPLVYCDGSGCTVAVHQACYGIVTVPTGPWFCRKCESPDTKGKVRCELCPSKSGALKRADTGGWAHVVCALYIPEVRFGNVTSMEPIVLRLIPAERYSKTCYICQDLGKTHRASAGACMQCNKSGCRQQFHVTCAQSLGLLCEEAGNYLDNVKYCGYCQHHYSKLKKGGNVKTIPPYKPVSHESHSSDSSGEKGGESPKTGGHTPTNSSGKSKAGRKPHANSAPPGKGAPAAKPATASQPMDTSHEGPTPVRKHKSIDHHYKHKPRRSPSRRSSTAGDSAGSKGSTPAPSPQHSSDNNTQPKGSGGHTPKVAASASPSSKESAGVIAAPAPPAPPAPHHTSPATSVVQAPKGQQESVITNTESAEGKQTKKRKAISASHAAAAAAAADYASSHHNQGGSPGAPASMWDSASLPPPPEPQPEPVDKIVKKAKTETPEGSMAAPHYPTPPPPPPPAHSPAAPSPRHLPSAMPGPSGGGGQPNLRSPNNPQGAPGREAPASLLVSVPLPSVSQSLHLSHQLAALANDQREQSAASAFHQVQKQAAMEQPAHAPHAPGRATWGGLNVSYEVQDPTNTQPGGGGSGKDAAGGVRNKKRAAMAASVVHAPAPPMQTSQGTMMGHRRAPQPTPPPVYQETIKDSPPSSPGSEKPLKPKMETNRLSSHTTAPHMLGNELNPESGACLRLQEQLSAELAAGGSAPPPPALVPPPLLNKAMGSSSGRSSSGAQSLDQLLERQWEQGSQFLMEQAQHFDIASLLSCLHQLRSENVRLEEHVGSLLQRRDHLLAVNARLAIPLTLHPMAVSAAPPETSGTGRGPRENGAPLRAPPPPRQETVTNDRHQQMMVREVQQKPS